MKGGRVNQRAVAAGYRVGQRFAVRVRAGDRNEQRLVRRHVRQHVGADRVDGRSGDLEPRLGFPRTRGDLLLRHPGYRRQ